MNTIFERVSIRKYEDKPIEKEKINQILKAAMQAPSAGDQQPWEFYVVRDREILKQLSEISEYSGPVARAAVAIVNVCDPEGKPFANVAPVDLAIATEHEWLEAADLGLGGVWIGVYPFEDRVKKANAILNIPEGQFVYSIVPLGYPAQDRKQKDRFHPERIHEIG